MGKWTYRNGEIEKCSWMGKDKTEKHRKWGTNTGGGYEDCAREKNG